MIAQFYTIISLLVFLILVGSGSAIDGAMIKSCAVFSVLIVLTRITVFMIDVIRKEPDDRADSSTKQSATVQ